MNPEEIDFILDLKKKIDAHCAGKDADDETCKLLYEKFYKIANNALKTTNATKETNQAVTPPILNEIKKDTNSIKETLDISAEASIDYTFIKNENVRSQLNKDNLRMENTYLSNEINNPMDRFYLFCVLAFYQIENLINYYYFEKFPVFENFVDHLKRNVSNFEIDREKGIDEIKASIKIYAFEKSFFYSRIDDKGKTIYYDSVIEKIKIVRNEESHRCSVIEKDKDGEYSLYVKLLDTIKKHRKNTGLSYQKSEAEKEVEKKGKIIKFIKDKDYNQVRACINEVNRLVKGKIEII